MDEPKKKKTGECQAVTIEGVWEDRRRYLDPNGGSIATSYLYKPGELSRSRAQLEGVWYTMKQITPEPLQLPATLEQREKFAKAVDTRAGTLLAFKNYLKLHAKMLARAQPESGVREARLRLEQQQADCSLLEEQLQLYKALMDKH
eukprot:g47398.t1